MEALLIEADKLQEEEAQFEFPTVEEIKDPKLKSLGGKILKILEGVQKKCEGKSIVLDSITSSEKINWQKLDDTNNEISALHAKRESLVEVLTMIANEDK
jgi:hypothetical protein